MKNKIFERPNGKYWTIEDIQELEKVKTYKEMAAIALRILDRMPGPKTQICGPISTGGKGSKEANIAEFNKAILFFSEKGENIFDQIPFQSAMEKLSKNVEGYDERILTEFYLPLFESGKVTTFKFLPGWKSSRGAKWERKTIRRLMRRKAFKESYKIVNLKPGWDNLRHSNKQFKRKIMSEKNKYNERGVSSDKEDVHEAIKNIDKGIFPRAFCKIIPDMLAGGKFWCNIMHADGAGTKSSLGYLYWKETGDLSVWKGIIQDSVIMNLDDLVCVGAVNVPILISGSIGRNKHLIPKEVIAELIKSTEEFLEKLRGLGIEIYSTGGETADVGDLVRTIIVDNTAICRMKRSKVIDTNIQPSNIIVGLPSFGQATYEDEYNGGMGSNGLTSARHDALNKRYVKKYPETFDPNTKKKLIYCGSHMVDGKVPDKYFERHPYENTQTVGKLILSPTRTYAPVIKEVINTIGSKKINAIIHCSGSGQTKVMNFVFENMHIIKDNMFDLPPLFQMIQEESQTPWKEMYKTFNMGHRMELYVKDEETANKIIKISESFNIDAKIIGHVEAYEGKKLTIKSEYGEFIY